MRQPEAAADHRHTWVFCRTAREKFLSDDLTAQTKGQFLGGSPSAAWDTPSPRWDWAPSTRLPQGGGAENTQDETQGGAG